MAQTLTKHYLNCPTVQIPISAYAHEMPCPYVTLAAMVCSRLLVVKTISLMALCACMLGGGSSAFALEPDFPSRDSRAIRIIVPFAAGGGMDLQTRTIAKKLNERWGHPVVVDNRPGASGAIGAEFAARALPDGHTLLMINISYAVQPSLVPRLPYNLVRDFAPIIHVLNVPNIVVVHPSLPVASIGDLIALAKKNPGQLHFAGGGIGGPLHLSGTLFNRLAGIKMVHVPYKGSAPAIIDLLGGHIEVMFPAMQAPLPHVRSGKLRALAVTSLQRSATLPDLPTVAESGVKGYEFVGWQGLLVRSGTPPAVVDKLYSEILAILKTEEVQQLLAGQGAHVVGAGPKEFAAHIDSEVKKWAGVVAQAKIELETK